MARLKLFNVHQVANILSLSPRTVYRWIADGMLPYVKIRGSVRIIEEDLLSLIEELRDQQAYEHGFEYAPLFNKEQGKV